MANWVAGPVPDLSADEMRPGVRERYLAAALQAQAAAEVTGAPLRDVVPEWLSPLLAHGYLRAEDGDDSEQGAFGPSVLPGTDPTVPPDESSTWEGDQDGVGTDRGSWVKNKGAAEEESFHPDFNNPAHPRHYDYWRPGFKGSQVPKGYRYYPDTGILEPK